MRPAARALDEEDPMEGIINPLAVQERFQCRTCGHEWLAYEVEPDARPACPVCHGEDVRLLA